MTSATVVFGAPPFPTCLSLPSCPVAPKGPHPNPHYRLGPASIPHCWYRHPWPFPSNAILPCPLLTGPGSKLSSFGINLRNQTVGKQVNICNGLASLLPRALSFKGKASWQELQKWEIPMVEFQKERVVRTFLGKGEGVGKECIPFPLNPTK